VGGSAAQRRRARTGLTARRRRASRRRAQERRQRAPADRRAITLRRIGIGTCGAVFVVICSFGAASARDFNAHLEEGQPVAVARATDEGIRGGRSARHYYVISFTTMDGRRVETSVPAGDVPSVDRVGDTVTVRYAPEEPDYYVREASLDGSEDVPLWIASTLASALVAVGGFAGRLDWLIRR